MQSTARTALIGAQSETTNLLHNQLQVWIAQALLPDQPIYNLAVALKISGEIDLRSFQDAFQTLLNSSDALRTVFEVKHSDLGSQDALGAGGRYDTLTADLGGNPTGSQTALLIGVGANPGALNLDEEIRRFEWKVRGGAEFVVTQPVFDIQLLERFLRRIEAFRIPVIAGLWPGEVVATKASGLLRSELLKGNLGAG